MDFSMLMQLIDMEGILRELDLDLVVAFNRLFALNDVLIRFTVISKKIHY